MRYFRRGDPKKKEAEATASFASLNIHHCLFLNLKLKVLGFVKTQRIQLKLVEIILKDKPIVIRSKKFLLLFCR